MNNKWNKTGLAIGVCYYPEQWDRSLWKEDLMRMRANGISVVRIAEFAWSVFEPEEGVFTFEVFDAFMALAKETGMKVIFGTPTATPPVWLTEKYPQVLNADIDGVLYRHGCRRHYNYTSEKYHELSAIIVEKLAGHYGRHESIVGWQIDNEFNCEFNEFYSESDTLAFREFLQRKYHTIAALNSAWGTVFWNQTYTDWKEIYVPRKVSGNSNNPHQVQDYIRFISDSVCKYAKMQSDIIRSNISPDVFITTNGLFGHIDNHRMTEESLDVYMYDSYPNFAYVMDADPLHSEDLNDRKWSRNLSEVRAVSPVFGIMEQQSGANGWNTKMEAPTPKPGQLTLWTMQSIAHGADFVSYFRWRTSTKGTEIYWHGILDYANGDNRRLSEVKEVSKLIESIGETVGARYRAAFAVIKDYDNVWDAEIDKWHERIEKVSQAGIFQAAELSHTPMDYLYLKNDTAVTELMAYPVLFYPHPTIMTNERAELLSEYVNGGGTLIFGCRSAYKDISGQCVMEKLPWLLRDLTGTDVLEYTFVGPADERSYIKCGDDRIEAAVFNDVLAPLTGAANVIGTYESNFYQGSAGLIENSYGSGKCYYFGGTFTRDTAAWFLEKLSIASPYRKIIELPACCELAVREKGGVRYIFVLNYEKGAQEIMLHETLTNLYTGVREQGKKVLKGYGTVVYRNHLSGE